MRVTFITEGVSEFKSLPRLYSQLRARSGNIFLSTLKIHVAPDVAPGIIARECVSCLKIAAVHRSDKAILILDRERQSACPGAIASAIRQAVLGACDVLPLEVVLKDRKFENWLVADIEALKSLTGRFQVSRNHEGKIAPDRADRCDAEAILKACAREAYEKVADADRILHKLDVARAAANSRSFRHLLHVVGDTSYATQCVTPAS